MSKYIRRLCTVILTGTVCLSVFSGCSASGENTPTDTSKDASESVSGGDTAEENSEEGALETVPGEDSGAGSEEENGSLGTFVMKDIYGETYTEAMFQDYEITMVNIFATWCSPCISEIPDLEKLYEQMKEQGVGVAGIVLDAVDFEGNTDEEAVEKAKILAEQTAVTYPFLIPDESLLNGRLSRIEAVPETFFVDKNGSVIGNTYVGSRSLEEWKTIVETEQNALKEENL